ncbi:MAG: hypothetical protein WAM11_11125 [Cyanobium sp.]
MFLIHSSPDQAPLLAAAVVSACRLPGGWVDPLQPRLLRVLFTQLLGWSGDPEAQPPITAAVVAQALPQPSQRRELIELMVVLEMVCRPIPEALQASVQRWAEALRVDGPSLRLVRDLVGHSQALATADFYRLCWIGEGLRDDPRLPVLLRRFGLRAFALTVEPDPAVSERWRALDRLPEGSLGRAMARFYADRGFRLPGEVGGGNEALAHHDWVHVVTGFDTTPIGEIEVTAFMAAASRSPGAMVGFLGVVSIYGTGLLRSVVVDTRYAHTLEAPGAPERVARAVARGARCRVDPLLDLDYFALAAEPLSRLRSDWGVDEDMEPTGVPPRVQPS